MWFGALNVNEYILASEIYLSFCHFLNSACMLGSRTRKMH